MVIFKARPKLLLALVAAVVTLSVTYYLASTRDSVNIKSNSYTIDDDTNVVVYNRIPKTGSTSFMHLIPYKLADPNGVNVAGVNISGSGLTSYTLSLKDRVRLMANMTSWSVNFPAVYHGHFAYFDIPQGILRSSSTKPVWINVIRKPVDRLVSFYYFLRYGDDLRINKVRSRMGDKVTFDECVELKHSPDCDPHKLWLQVPWFCGHARRCWNPPGNDWALHQAKRNLVEKYLVVGVTEDLESFIEIVEWLLPKFFRGAASLYKQEGSKGNNHIRRTKHKDTVSEATMSVLKNTKIWRAEQDFYDFALAQFNAIKDERAKSLKSESPDKPHFHYERLKGPNA